MASRKTSGLTESDLRGITKTFDTLGDAIDALQDAVQHNAIDHATIKTRLEDVLVQLKGLSQTVNGDQGLLTRVSVLESRLRAAEVDIEKKAHDLRKELSKDVEDLRSSVEQIRRSQEKKTQHELDEVKSERQLGKSRGIALWATLVSTLALAASLIFGSVQNCQAKAPKTTSSSARQEP